MIIAKSSRIPHIGNVYIDTAKTIIDVAIIAKDVYDWWTKDDKKR